MSDLPVVSREAPVSVVTSVIPVSFSYPGLSLAQIGSIVWAYRRLTILTVILVLALTVLTLTRWPRTYTAVVTLMVNYEVNDPLNGKELPLGQVGSYIATQMELMRTPEVLLAVVDRFKLAQNEDYTRGYRGDSGTLREWVARTLSKQLTVYQGQQGSQLIHLTYSADDPAEAAQLANAIAGVYQEQDYLRSTGPPGERAKRYAEQLDELKAKVEQAQEQVTAFRQRSGLIDEGTNATDTVLLATLEGRLVEARNARYTAEARASGDQSANDQALASDLIQSLKAQLAAHESRLAVLNTIYWPHHPDIQQLRTQMDATRTSLASALQTYSASESAGLSMARRLEQSLERTIARQRAKLLVNSQLHDEGAKYLLELESAQVVYKRALQGYDQIMFASAGHSSNVSFISRATPPVKATKPKVLTGLILGAMAAAFLGLGIPMGYELFNRRVRCRDDLERHHGIPVLVEFGRLTVRTAA